MKIELISVTPELAAQWLATNTDRNRRISKTTVNRYAQDMIRDQWLVTGEAIKFDREGKLIDGQHRLSAVVASKKNVQMCVIRDLDEATMLVIDTGKSRSAGDALAIAGHNGMSNELAALTRKVIAHQAGTLSILERRGVRIGDKTITNHQIVDYCSQYDLSEHVNFSARMKKKAVSGALIPAEYAFFHWLFSQKDPVSAEAFLSKLALLENVGSDDPIRTLHTKLTKGTKLDGKMKLHAVITAWNAWRTGQKLTVIHVGRIEQDTAIPQAV